MVGDEGTEVKRRYGVVHVNVVFIFFGEKKRLKGALDYIVSWVRHRDIHLLTVGRYTYTSDQRFEAMHTPHSEEWTLQIRYPQKKDSGVYECQISTTPPIGLPVHLTIVEFQTVRFNFTINERSR
ncbi:hypothetical protein HZH66_013873 [Vespula vulgaris]|uniref:Ig-like domain-containing protein n=1 Tax=Vespula vulgaris TaxID=7454 RepID=A0A834J6R4_VESVU|nr:hypothetical protein HZH66_013873 [Vespula vulgaris]